MTRRRVGTTKGLRRARSPRLPRRAHPAQQRACNEQTRTWCVGSFVPEPGPAGADPSAEARLRGPGAEQDEERGEGEQQEVGASGGARQVDGGAHPRGGGARRRRVVALLFSRTYVKSVLMVLDVFSFCLRLIVPFLFDLVVGRRCGFWGRCADFFFEYRLQIDQRQSHIRFFRRVGRRFRQQATRYASPASGGGGG